jgi:glycosyltransferase involved in cell wall biosynthesis
LLINIFVLMGHKYNPIFVVKSFCISNNPGGIQSRRFISALIQKEINPTIFTKKSDLTSVLDKKFDIVVSKTLSEKYFTSFLRRILPDLIFIPDIERFTFKPFIENQIKKINGKYDWIHTISYPCSNHLIGMAIKKKLNIPWVAHFYDPWVGNPYRKHRFKNFKAFDLRLEEEVATNADIILHTNTIIIQDWISRYGKLVSDKIFLFPFNYDNELFEYAKTFSVNKGKGIKKNLLHVGNLYLQRNLDDLIKALLYLRKLQPNIDEKLSIVLAGIVAKNDLKKIKKYGFERIFQHVGVVNHSDLICLYQKSDALLLIDAPANKNMFFPSKLMEYLIYKKPILGITPNIGITNDLLISSGHRSINNGSTIEIANYLNDLINNYDSLVSFNQNFYEQFSPNNIAEKYLSILNARFRFNNSESTKTA